MTILWNKPFTRSLTSRTNSKSFKLPFTNDDKSVDEANEHAFSANIAFYLIQHCGPIKLYYPCIFVSADKFQLEIAISNQKKGELDEWWLDIDEI